MVFEQCQCIGMVYKECPNKNMVNDVDAHTVPVEKTKRLYPRTCHHAVVESNDTKHLVCNQNKEKRGQPCVHKHDGQIHET